MKTLCVIPVPKYPTWAQNVFLIFYYKIDIEKSAYNMNAYLISIQNVNPHVTSSWIKRQNVADISETRTNHKPHISLRGNCSSHLCDI